LRKELGLLQYQTYKAIFNVIRLFSFEKEIIEGADFIILEN
jgi:hypothetical protein